MSPSSGVVPGLVTVSIAHFVCVSVSVSVPRRAGWIPKFGSIPSAISCFELRVECSDGFDGIDGIGESA